MTTPLFGLSGFKNSGKTTLTAALIAEFSARGFKVSSVKHAHHEFDLDQPGTDTDKHRRAGAREVVIASARRWALMHEIGADESEPDLHELVRHMAPADLILAEGFKSEAHPKILLIANDEQAKLMQRIENVVAVAAAGNIEIDRALPRFGRDDIAGIASFIEEYLELEPRK